MIINFKKYLCLMFQILHRYADRFYHCLIETLMITSNTSGGVTEMKEALFFLGCIGTSHQKLNPNQELSCWFCCQTICYHIFGIQNVIPVVNATYWQPLLAFLVESCWPPKTVKEEMLHGLVTTTLSKKPISAVLGTYAVPLLIPPWFHCFLHFITY